MQTHGHSWAVLLDLELYEGKLHVLCMPNTDPGLGQMFKAI